ncbi:MAG: oligosaccharide flippase family protein [Deltaproteobacteria bacterium]|nr:oligosaccharide flippase family protein [Deltaproteobacteria bacterium]MBI3295065.1 oligosaccharide flippase family protein [Deltaproteobacteria bacterium]
MADKAHFEKTLLLTAGQAVGVGLSFMIPILLSRWLTVEDYGIYKQIFFIHGLLLLTVHMGMDWGLFYFIKRNPQRAGVYSLNVVLTDLALAMVVAGVAYLFRREIASELKSPGLETLIPAFIPFVVFSVPTHHFNHLLVVRDRMKAAVVLTIAFELAKTLIIVGGYFFSHSLAFVLVSLGGLAVVRLSIHLGYNIVLIRSARLRFLDLRRSIVEQVRYAIPLGFTNLLSLCLKMDKFLVSAFFGLRAFTIYSVGCFEVPMVESTIITMNDLMSFDMVEARARGDREVIHFLWRSTLRKITLFHLPVAIFMIAFSGLVIPALYTDTYAESVAYFRFFSVLFFVSQFVPDVVFRVFARNKTQLVLQGIAGVYTIAIVVAMGLRFGPLGILGGKIVADTLSMLIKLSALRAIIQISWRELIPWRDLGVILGGAIFCALITHVVVDPIPLPGLLAVPLAFAFYAGFNILVATQTGALRSDEIAYFKDRLKGRETN